MEGRGMGCQLLDGAMPIEERVQFSEGFLGNRSLTSTNQIRANRHRSNSQFLELNARDSLKNSGLNQRIELGAQGCGKSWVANECSNFNVSLVPGGREICRSNERFAIIHDHTFRMQRECGRVPQLQRSWIIKDFGVTSAGPVIPKKRLSEGA